MAQVGGAEEAVVVAAAAGHSDPRTVGRDAKSIRLIAIPSLSRSTKRRITRETQTKVDRGRTCSGDATNWPKPARRMFRTQRWWTR